MYGELFLTTLTRCYKVKILRSLSMKKHKLFLSSFSPIMKLGSLNQHL